MYKRRGKNDTESRFTLKALTGCRILLTAKVVAAQNVTDKGHSNTIAFSRIIYVNEDDYKRTAHSVELLFDWIIHLKSITSSCVPAISCFFICFHGRNFQKVITLSQSYIVTSSLMKILDNFSSVICPTCQIISNKG